MKLSLPVAVGCKGRKYMPYSEVCMHMQIAGKVMRFKVVSPHSVQLYKDDGTPFSSPITTGEAGLFRVEEGFYYYPDDCKNDSDPSIESHWVVILDNVHYGPFISEQQAEGWGMMQEKPYGVVELLAVPRGM